jgi:broad specificity phosphatase PhoE
MPVKIFVFTGILLLEKIFVLPQPQTYLKEIRIMVRRFSRFVMFFALFVVLAGAAYAQDLPTVVVVVRHAEKAADGGNDPSLSDAGVKRAQELVELAEEAGVTAIYTTQYKRAMETARPLSARLSVPVSAVEINRENAGTYTSKLAKDVLAKHAGQVILIIGHSNTVPEIVEALGGKRPAAIDDATEFDRVFVVIVPKSGGAKVIKTRYGQRKPETPKP